jgi:hypothetical protein
MGVLSGWTPAGSAICTHTWMCLCGSLVFLDCWIYTQDPLRKTVRDKSEVRVRVRKGNVRRVNVRSSGIKEPTKQQGFWLSTLKYLHSKTQK